MKKSEFEISQEIAAKALIDIAYSQQLINQETYLKPESVNIASNI